MLKIGDKIHIPTVEMTANGITSTKNCSALESLSKGQDFLYINRITGNEVTVGSIPNELASSFYIKDIKLYEEVLPEAYIIQTAIPEEYKEILEWFGSTYPGMEWYKTTRGDENQQFVVDGLKHKNRMYVCKAKQSYPNYPIITYKQFKINIMATKKLTQTKLTQTKLTKSQAQKYDKSLVTNGMGIIIDNTPGVLVRSGTSRDIIYFLQNNGALIGSEPIKDIMSKYPFKYSWELQSCDGNVDLTYGDKFTNIVIGSLYDTSKIDTEIEAAKKLIAKLEEQKQKTIEEELAKLKEKEVPTHFHGWDIKKGTKDQFVFGCGDFKVTKAEITGFVKIATEIQTRGLDPKEAFQTAQKLIK